MVKFYIAQYGSQRGTVINVSVLSNKAAEIDFTGKGVHAAFVKQLSGGGWEIKYGTAKAMLEESQAFTAKQKRSLLNARQQDIAKLMYVSRLCIRHFPKPWPHSPNPARPGERWTERVLM